MQKIIAPMIYKILLLLCMLFLSSCATTAQDYCSQFKDHPCGNPCMVSSDYYCSTARIIQILDCTHLEIELIKQYSIFSWNADRPPMSNVDVLLKRFQARLAGIIPIDGGSENVQRCIEELKQLPFGTMVSVWDLHSEEARLEAPAIPVRLFLMTGTEINEALIKRGLVAVEDPDRVTGVDWWTECNYRLLEKKAKEKDRGLWAKANQK